MTCHIFGEATADMRSIILIAESDRRMTADAYRRAITLAVRGAVDLSWSTSHRFPLDDAPEAFATASRREGLKVVVDLSG